MPPRLCLPLEGSTCRAQRLFGQTTTLCQRTSQAFKGMGQREDLAWVWGSAHQSPAPPAAWAVGSLPRDLPGDPGRRRTPGKSWPFLRSAVPSGWPWTPAAQPQARPDRPLSSAEGTLECGCRDSGAQGQQCGTPVGRLRHRSMELQPELGCTKGHPHLTSKHSIPRQNARLGLGHCSPHPSPELRAGEDSAGKEGGVLGDTQAGVGMGASAGVFSISRASARRGGGGLGAWRDRKGGGPLKYLYLFPQLSLKGTQS